ncbi:MAG: TonB-dependent receptor [Candidatus Zixiibacteriota bacterium]
MLIQKRYREILIFVFMLIFWASLVWGGTSGKIAGTLRNKITGGPLPGVTIMISGTNIGTSTDEDGDYFLINIPPGNYTLQATLIGYEPVFQKGVKVLLDLTTPVDFELMSSPIELVEGITVVAERPMIQKDLTYSGNIVTREELDNLPNAVNLQTVISNMAGTVVDEDGLLHIRGGRDGTVSYFLDGVNVQDPFVGQAGTRITPDALEELDVTTGGFTAEYGEALSGVVSAITKRGTHLYQGKVKFYDGATSSYDVHTGSFKSLTRNKNQSMVLNLGGPLTFTHSDRATFFLTSEYLRDDGYLPHNQVELYSHTGKITLKPTSDIIILLTGNYYQRDRQRYQHRDVNNFSYDFNLDGLGKIRNKAYHYGAKITYPASKNTIYTMKFNHFFTEAKLAPEHLFDLYWDEWSGYSVDSNGVYNGTIHTQNYNVDPEYFNTGFTKAPDFFPVYHYRKTQYNSFGLDLISQIDKYNQIKLGGEYRANRLKWDDKQFFNIRPYGERYVVNPTYAAFYVQDKIEFREIILNAGLRLDYVDADIDFWDDPVKKNIKVHTKSKTQLSPRLGISHPVSDLTVIHFNYGYYFQVPQYRYMFTNLQGDLSTGYPLVGNPNMEAEKTVAYEMGMTHMFTQNVRLKLTAYYKDLSNLATSREVVYAGGSYIQYTNADYGSVKGFDLILTKIPSDHLSGSINYTYSIAKGNASSVTEGYYDYFTQGTGAPVWPVKEYPLSFDQRHTISADIDYRVPRSWQGKFLGLIIPGAWGVNMLAQYGSGLPYTKTDDQGYRVGMLNEGRLPPTYRMDMRFNKDFYFFKDSDLHLTFFTEVENLFDRRNVIDVYSNTGKADDDGRYYVLTPDPDGEGPLTAEDVNHYYRLLAKDPQNYGSPRRIRWGLELVF